MPGHDRRVAPADPRVGDGLAIGGDEAPRGGIGEHRRIGRDVGATPSPQFQALGLDDGTLWLGKRDAGLERG